MSHTYVSSLVHVIFSTKDRKRFLHPEIQERLWPFIGGVAKSHSIKTLAIGGLEDHAHILLSMPADVALSRAMQSIKGASSRWIHESFPALRDFSWQEGYGAFSVSISGMERTISYIRLQAEHHKKRSFEEEFLGFLKAHSIAYDPRYVFG